MQSLESIYHISFSYLGLPNDSTEIRGRRIGEVKRLKLMLLYQSKPASYPSSRGSLYEHIGEYHL